MRNHQKISFILAAVLMLAVASGWGQTNIADYEARSWSVWGIATAPTFDGTHVNAGSEAMRVNCVCDGGTDWGGLVSNQFLAEVGTGLSSGFSVRVYTERVSGIDDPPIIKFEIDLEAGGNQSGSDFTPTVNGWTTITIDQSQLTADYNLMKFIFFENSKTGEFNFWFDTIQREGATWDDFESDLPTNIQPWNFWSGTPVYRGNITLGGSTLVSGGPIPTESGHAYGMVWTGDTDNRAEILHDYSPYLSVGDTYSILVDVYVPGVNLPTIGIWLNDSAATGSGFTGSVVTASGNWETIEVSLSGVEAALIETEIASVSITIDGFPDGEVYIDNLQLADTATAVDDWFIY
jgi:hypothetical protein